MAQIWIDDLDYVVLQEQSVNPFENYTRFLNGVKSLKQKIQSTQKHSKIYLYETWGSPYSANERSITVPAMEAKLKDDLGADSIDAVQIIMDLEDTFGVTIEEDNAEAIQTVGNLVEYVQTLIK